METNESDFRKTPGVAKIIFGIPKTLPRLPRGWHYSKGLADWLIAVDELGNEYFVEAKDDEAVLYRRYRATFVDAARTQGRLSEGDFFGDFSLPIPLTREIVDRSFEDEG